MRWHANNVFYFFVQFLKDTSFEKAKVERTFIPFSVAIKQEDVLSCIRSTR